MIFRGMVVAAFVRVGDDIRLGRRGVVSSHCQDLNDMIPLALAFLAFLAPTITTGEIVSYTINGSGEVTQFVVDTNGSEPGGLHTFECNPPNKDIKTDIQQAMDDETDVTVTDQDGDNKFEPADTIKFN